MEPKKLNFSAPLLSARRYSSPLRSSSAEEPKQPDSFPENKSTAVPSKQQRYLKLDGVVKPGSVPFHWEQIPGRAKGDSRLHSPEAEEETPSTTRLPPGKNFDSRSRISGLKSRELPSSHRPPHDKLSGELNLIRPQGKFSGEVGRLTRVPNGLPSFPTTETVTRAHLFTQVFDTEGDYRSETDDDDDIDFSDAFESSSMKCSTTGLSASDNNRGCRPSGTFSSEVENRDFMINRFLPAAKAMTLESPQYTSKRQLVAVEPPPISKAIIPKIVKEVPPPPLLQTKQNVSITLYKGQDVRSQRSKDVEADSSNDPGEKNSMSVKSRWFFPWFWSKNALRLLNPFPAMKAKTKNALAAACKVGRTLVRNASYRSPTRSSSKHVRQVGSVTKSCELHQIEMKPNGHKPRPMFYSGELTRHSDLQARNGLSPYRNYRSNVSPCRNKSPHSPFHQSAGFLIVPKRVDQPNYAPKLIDRYCSFSGPLLSHRRNTQGLTGPGCPITEKTFFVDSPNVTRSRQSMERKDILKARWIRKPLVCRTLDACPPSSLDHGLAKKSQCSERSRLLLDQHEQVNPSKEMVLRSEDLTVKSLHPPPLPKSPSESWLSCNPNSVLPRNSFSYSNDGAAKFRKQSPAKALPPPPPPPPPPSVGSVKWETIVKSSHLRCHHGRFSEELVAQAVPKQPQTRSESF